MTRASIFITHLFGRREGTVAVGPASACARGVGLVLAVLLFVGCAELANLRAAFAETNLTDSSGGPVISVKALEARLAEARANLAAATALGDAGLTNAPAGVSPQDISVRRAGLQRLVRLYELQLSSIAELEAAKTRKAEIVREAQGWTRFEEPQPYSILLTDRLREELQTEQLKVSNADASAATLAQLIEENRQALALAEGRIRQLNEQLEGSPDPALAARLSWQREQERLRSQVGGGTLAVLDLERVIGQEVAAGSRLCIGLLQRQLVIADAGVKFTQADLETVTARIDWQREQAERDLADAQTRRAAAQRALASAREELRGLQTQPDSTPVATTRATEAVSARAAQLEATDNAIRILRLLLECGNMERSMWEMRFASYNSRSVETLRQSGRRLREVTRRLKLWGDHERQLMEMSPGQVQLQETRLNNLAPDSELLPLARERLAALSNSDQLLLRLVRTIEGLQRLTQRWEAELRSAEGRLPLTSRFQNLFSDGRSFLRSFWNFEVFTAEDTITVDGQKITGRRSVTIGKVVMAVFILVAGYWITGLISRVAEPIIVRRLKIEVNQANLIRRWMRTAMVVGLIMFSLVSVKIPLTVFAFAGGALAIGLGFGMQTILKNLVSGLIILFERPFRVGDVLDVGGQQGTMTSVGLRASVLQLWDNTETLIPNSTLLENNLTNWTYSNNRVRFTVKVGVAYSSDPRRVIQALGEVAERHGLVEKSPKPQVLFTEFGESTLTFELRFWLDVAQANAGQVSSDLRLMIAVALAESGITIAFPQRDLHLHAARPIPVELIARDSGVGKGTDPNPAEAADKPGAIP